MLIVEKLLARDVITTFLPFNQSKQRPFDVLWLVNSY